MSHRFAVAEQVATRSDELKDPSPGLAAALRERTRGLHEQAERSGIIRRLLKGSADCHGYALLLRNLLPAYQEMERQLELHRNAPGVRLIALPELYRADALEQDIREIEGAAWRLSLPLLGSGRRYAARIAESAEHEPARLVGHAYVRYLGDLNGGQILRRLFSRSLGLEQRHLSFYDFPAIPDLGMFKLEIRAKLNCVAMEVTDTDNIVAEALEAFRLNIDLSHDVERAMSPGRALEPMPIRALGI